MGRNFLDLEGDFSLLERARFVVLPVPYERTTTYKKGTRLAPEAIIYASSQLELFDEELKEQTYKEGIHTLAPFEPPQDLDPEEFIKNLAEHIQLYIDMDKFLFMLGGEHTISIAGVRAYTMRYPELSVLCIDAHPDLRDQYEGSKYNHACTIRRISEMVPTVLIGVRTCSEEEYPFTSSKEIRTFFTHLHRNIKEFAPRILTSLTQNVYISIDVDGFDPSWMPAVGTPVPGGLMWYETLDILRAVIQNKNVVGVDIVELSPINGNVVSEFTIAKLCYRLMGFVIAKEKRKARRIKGG
jgi:agmatinase